MNYSAISSPAAIRLLGFLFFVAWPLPSLSQICDDGLACYFEGRASNGALEFDIGSEVPLLTGFELEFLGGDRHVRTLAVGVSAAAPSTFRLRLQDNDGAASIRGWARYFRYGATLQRLRETAGTAEDSPVMHLRTVSRNGCRGGCRVEVPGFDKRRYYLFLSGFEFTFTGKDRHLREVEIWPSGTVAGPTSLWTSFKDDSDDQPYNIVITYVLIPTEHGERSVLSGGGVREPDDDGVVMFPDRNRSGRALGGFGLAYSRDDEHVLKLGVKLDRSGASAVLRDNDAREEVGPKVASRILPVE